jgi:hypothetical protein
MTCAVRAKLYVQLLAVRVRLSVRENSVAVLAVALLVDIWQPAPRKQCENGRPDADGSHDP